MAASGIFHMFTQSIKFCIYIPLSHIKEVQMFEKEDSHQIDGKNEWLLLSERFMAKFELVSVVRMQSRLIFGYL